VDDLDKILLLPCPVIHGGHILAGSLRPLCDERLTRPAAARPIEAVGVGKAAGGIFPHDRQGLAADIRRAVGCAGAEVITSEGDYTVYLCIAFGQIKQNVILVFILLGDLTVDHDGRALDEVLGLGALNGVRLKVRQADRCRCGFGRRCRCGGCGRCRRRGGLVKLVICLHGAIYNIHECSRQHHKKQYFNHENYWLSLFLFIHLYPPQNAYSVKCI